MSRIRTKPTESAMKRLAIKDRLTRSGRMTRAEMEPPGPLLEYTRSAGGPLKWCGLFFGGETRAGN